MNGNTISVLVALLFVLGIGGYLAYTTTNPSVPIPTDEETLDDLSDREQLDTDAQPAPRTVSLFYYDPTRDQDENGNVMCTRDGLVPVTRQIATMTPVEETVRLLIAGNLTSAERAAGITTEYPLSGVTLSSVALSAQGELTVALNDPEGRTGGGSCRAAILWAQIRETALQFPEVREVSFEPDDLFQP